MNASSVDPTRPDVGEHDMFVVGEVIFEPPSTEDPEDKGRLVAVLSTYNLLMNGWRSLRSGGPLVILLDTTYKLVIEGHGTVGMCVVDEAQHSHLIGVAVVNREDQIAMEHCVRQLKRGVEEAVQKYTTQGLRA